MIKLKYWQENQVLQLFVFTTSVKPFIVEVSTSWIIFLGSHHNYVFIVVASGDSTSVG